MTMTSWNNEIEVSIRVDRAFVRRLGGKTAMQFKLRDPVDLLRLQLHWLTGSTNKNPIKADSLFYELQSFVELCEVLLAAE